LVLDVSTLCQDEFLPKKKHFQYLCTIGGIQEAMPQTALEQDNGKKLSRYKGVAVRENGSLLCVGWIDACVND